MQDKVGQETLEIMATAGFYNQWLYGFIAPFLTGNVAEVGAGIGAFASKMADGGLKVTALDINPDYLKLVRKKMPQVQTFEFDLQSARTPAALVNSFDTVIAINVLEHVANLELALKNIYSMLRPGGKLIVLVPAFQFAFGQLDKNLGHYKRFTKTQFTNYLHQVNLRLVSQRYINFWGLWGWWLNSRLLKRQIISPSQVFLFDLLARPWLILEKFVSMPMGLSLVCIAQKP